MLHRPLNEIAEEAIKDWIAIPSYALSYLVPLCRLNSITEAYGVDSASSVVRYFLANAITWRGDTARKVKAELKAILKDFDSNEELQVLADQSIRDAYKKPSITLVDGTVI